MPPPFSWALSTTRSPSSRVNVRAVSLWLLLTVQPASSRIPDASSRVVPGASVVCSSTRQFELAVPVPCVTERIVAFSTGTSVFG